MSKEAFFKEIQEVLKLIWYLLIYVEGGRNIYYVKIYIYEIYNLHSHAVYSFYVTGKRYYNNKINSKMYFKKKIIGDFKKVATEMDAKKPSSETPLNSIEYISVYFMF